MEVGPWPDVLLNVKRSGLDSSQAKCNQWPYAKGRWSVHKFSLPKRVQSLDC